MLMLKQFYVLNNFRRTYRQWKIASWKGDSCYVANGWEQVTLAHLKDKPAQTPANSTSSSGSGGVRFTTRLLGAGNGSRGLGFGGGNGFTGRLSGTSKSTTIPITGMSSSNGPMTSSFDGEGTYLIFNVGDALFISDYNSQDKASICELLLSQVISIRIVRRLVQSYQRD